MKESTLDYCSIDLSKLNSDDEKNVDIDISTYVIKMIGDKLNNSKWCDSYNMVYNESGCDKIIVIDENTHLYELLTSSFQLNDTNISIIHVTLQQRVFGEWKITNILGKGGYGIVKLARSNEKLIALKFINIDYKKHSQRANMILKNSARTEMKALKMISEASKRSRDGYQNSGNVIAIIENALKSFSGIAIPLEYMEYGDLRRFIKLKQAAGKTLSQKLIKTCLDHILNGLNQIHQLNIVHRDLKPSNIMIDNKHQLKIIDFGVCKILDPSKQPRSLPKKCGTRNYIAPELVLQNKVLSNTEMLGVDIFSLGVILWQLLGCNVNSTPFKCKSKIKQSKKDFELIFKTNEIDKTNTNTNPLDLVEKMIAFDPCDRITEHQIKQHRWFKNVPSFSKVECMQVELFKCKSPLMYDSIVDAESKDTFTTRYLSIESSTVYTRDSCLNTQE